MTPEFDSGTLKGLVLDHPYAAVTDPHGKFTIPDLPAGQYEFVVWQERCGYIDRALKVTIPPGSPADLGVIKVPIAKFKL